MQRRKKTPADELTMAQVCRLLPWTVDNYKLNELITVRELRSNVHALFRQNSQVTNPGVRSVSYMASWISRV